MMSRRATRGDRFTVPMSASAGGGTLYLRACGERSTNRSALASGGGMAAVVGPKRAKAGVLMSGGDEFRETVSSMLEEAVRLNQTTSDPSSNGGPSSWRDRGAHPASRTGCRDPHAHGSGDRGAANHRVERARRSLRACHLPTEVARATILNVVDNALKVSPPGSTIQIPSTPLFGSFNYGDCDKPYRASHRPTIDGDCRCDGSCALVLASLQVLQNRSDGSLRLKTCSPGWTPTWRGRGNVSTTCTRQSTAYDLAPLRAYGGGVCVWIECTHPDVSDRRFDHLRQAVIE